MPETQAIEGVWFVWSNAQRCESPRLLGVFKTRSAAAGFRRRYGNRHKDAHAARTPVFVPFGSRYV